MREEHVTYFHFIWRELGTVEKVCNCVLLVYAKIYKLSGNEFTILCSFTL